MKFVDDDDDDDDDDHNFRGSESPKTAKNSPE